MSRGYLNTGATVVGGVLALALILSITLGILSLVSWGILAILTAAGMIEGYTFVHVVAIAVVLLLLKIVLGGNR